MDFKIKKKNSTIVMANEGDLMKSPAVGNFLQSSDILIVKIMAKIEKGKTNNYSFIEFDFKKKN